MKELPSTLPDDTRQAYLEYLKRPTLTRELLLAKVRPYIQVISDSAKAKPGLDIGTAGELGAALLRLLRECDESHLPHAQAAALYFLESEDAEPDLESAHGFDDDALVFNSVCLHLGREVLTIPVLPT